MSCRHIKFSVSLVELTYQAVDTARLLFEDLVGGRSEEVREEGGRSEEGGRKEGEVRR